MGCYRTGMAIGMGAWDWVVCVVGGLNAVRFLVRWWDLLCGELVRGVQYCAGWVGTKGRGGRVLLPESAFGWCTADVVLVGNSTEGGKEWRYCNISATTSLHDGLYKCVNLNCINWAFNNA